MPILLIIIGILITFSLSFGVWKIIGWLKPDSILFEKLLGVLLFYSLIIFTNALVNHSTPFYKDIDPFVEACYSPISYKNSVILILTHLFALLSLFYLYFKEFKLPPLLITIFIIFLTIGIISNFQFLNQISIHDTSRIHLWNKGHYAGLQLSLYPTLLIIISVGLLIKLIRRKATVNTKVQYENKWLNFINKKLVGTKNLPLFSILLVVPFLILILTILVLFGQDFESLTKVYSQTATWKFSQHLHPPTVDDRHGHYLCTVAAYGNPKIVKPIGIGRRNNKLIIINRQLQIANAFEYMVQNVSPETHKLIRHNYDKYGINLAKRINNQRTSTLTYVLMKPIEWIFVIFLYSYFVDPENVIKKQYTL